MRTPTAVGFGKVVPGGPLTIATGAPLGGSPCPLISTVRFWNVRMIVEGLVGPDGPYTLISDRRIGSTETQYTVTVPAEQPIGSTINVKAECDGDSFDPFFLTTEYVFPAQSRFQFVLSESGRTPLHGSCLYGPIRVPGDTTCDPRG